MSPFTIQELRQASLWLKNGKANHVDNIRAEMLKASFSFTLNHLLNIPIRLSNSVKPHLTEALLAKIDQGYPSVCDKITKGYPYFQYHTRSSVECSEEDAGRG